MVIGRIRKLARAIARRLNPPRPWHKDLCDYYGVTPGEALELGTRSSGRRPSLPASSTTHAVNDKTFEDIWETSERETPESIHRFYKDMGAWQAFRQVVFRHQHGFGHIAKDVRPGMRICEYGAGVAPVSFWLVENLRRMSLDITIVDVPSEHLTFGAWRLRRLIEEQGTRSTLAAQEVQPDGLPLEGLYDLITILEVYEHLHNPLEVTAHLCEHLSPGGLLWENYVIHDDAGGPDLEVAQKERPEVFEYLRQKFELVSGSDALASNGGETRCWKKMTAGSPTADASPGGIDGSVPNYSP